jgi:hypothetical protein
MNRRKILEITGLGALAGMLWPARGEAAAPMAAPVGPSIWGDGHMKKFSGHLDIFFRRPDQQLCNAILAQRMIECHAIRMELDRITEEVRIIHEEKLSGEWRGTPEGEEGYNKVRELQNNWWAHKFQLEALERAPIPIAVERAEQ